MESQIINIDDARLIVWQNTMLTTLEGQSSSTKIIKQLMQISWSILNIYMYSVKMFNKYKETFSKQGFWDFSKSSQLLRVYISNSLNNFCSKTYPPYNSIKIHKKRY